jgi:magnesium-transporting ATPase (P-type)
MLQAFKDSGIGRFQSRDYNIIKIALGSATEEYSVVKTFEFSSERKKMSIVVKSKDTGKHYLFTKGADDIIIKLLKEGELKVKAKIVEDAHTFSQTGLRTLAYAMKELSDKDIE